MEITKLMVVLGIGLEVDFKMYLLMSSYNLYTH